MLLTGSAHNSHEGSPPGLAADLGRLRMDGGLLRCRPCWTLRHLQLHLWPMVQMRPIISRGKGLSRSVPTICGSPSKDALACGDRLDWSGSGAGLGRAIVGDIAEAWELKSGARGRGSDCREVVIDGIPDRLDEHTAVSRLPEQGFVPPIGHEAHLEQHTWQGARAQNVEMCGARRRRDHPHVIGELFDHSVLEPGGPRRRLRFGRSQCPGDAVGVAFGRQLGVAGRFVQNCTLSRKLNEISGFHKRPFTKGSRPSGGAVLGYARVSKGDEQNNALQTKALKAAGCRRLFEEAASGGRWDRPELHRLLDHLREGDTVVVWKLDRLSRSLKDVLHIMERIGNAGAGFRSITENIDTTTPAGRMMMQMVGAFAEFERAMIRERTSAGLAAARAEGRSVGGARSSIPPSGGRSPRASSPAVNLGLIWRGFTESVSLPCHAS